MSAAYLVHDDPGRDALFAHLGQEGDLDVRKAITSQLADCGDLRLVPGLTQALADASQDDEAKQHAVYNLGKLNGPSVVESLVTALTNPVLENEAAAALLKRSDPQGLRAVLAAAQKPGTRSDRFAGRAAEALNRPGTPESDETLTELVLFGLEHSYDSVRMETLRALQAASLRVPRIRAKVEAAQHDSYDICRTFAKAIMAQAGDVDALIERARSARFAPREEALDRLAALGTAEANAVVQQVRQQKQEALARVGGVTAGDETIAAHLLAMPDLDCSLVGESLYEAGGHERMVRVATLYKRQGGNIRLLESMWHGIGSFRELVTGQMHLSDFRRERSHQGNDSRQPEEVG